MSYSYGLLPNPPKSGHAMRLIYLAVFIGGLVGCDSQTPGAATMNGRWYTAEQVDLGRRLFSAHCADCHGDSAEGTSDWRDYCLRSKYLAGRNLRPLAGNRRPVRIKHVSNNAIRQSSRTRGRGQKEVIES